MTPPEPHAGLANGYLLVDQSTDGACGDWKPTTMAHAGRHWRRATRTATAWPVTCEMNDGRNSGDKNR